MEQQGADILEGMSRLCRGLGLAVIGEGVDLAGEPQVAKLLRRGGQAVHCADAPFHVLGPYYATSAAVVEIGDQLVVLGHPTQCLEAEDLAAAAPAIARAAVAEVVAVSPAKPLADELEVLQAVQSLLNFGGSGSAEALAHLLAVVVASLSSATEARTDVLTGLLYRKGWDEQLGAHSRSGECGVVVIDLNDFKELNDRYGHGAGDSALRDVADLLTSFAPSGAVIARTGGDEFAILLLDVSEDETDAVGDRLSGRIHITDPLIDMVVTVAVGTAWTPGGAQLPHAVTGADRMMYVDKAAARAR